MGYNYPHFSSPVLQGFYDWQGIIGATLALGAAYYGGRILWKQIRVSEDQETERQRRRFAAARATMPLLLSGICSYARDVAVALRGIYPAAGQTGFGADSILETVPNLPAELPQSLERLIESTGNDALAEQLADLLGHLQVLHARIAEIPNLSSGTVGLQLMVEEYMLQVANVYADASSLFGYARREVEDPAESERMMTTTALNLLEMRDYDFGRLHETAIRRAAQAAARINGDVAAQ